MLRLGCAGGLLRLVLETGCTGPTIVTAARQVGLAAGAHRAVQGEVQLVMLAQRGARHLEQRGAHRRDHLVDVARQLRHHPLIAA